MQQRRGTAAQWISTNEGNGPILAPGELGWESDTNKFKVGDGVNHWIDLDYFTTDSATAVTEQINAAISGLVDGAPGLLDTLNELAAAINDDPTFFTTIATNLSNHESDTTNVHGIADTAELATKTYVADAVGNATVDQSALAGDGIDWNATTEQFDVDTTVVRTSNLSELAQDAVNTAIVAGIGLDKNYDDNANTITIDIDSTVATKTYADGKASDARTAAETTAANALSSHESDTTNVHGIADTAELATKSFAASLLTGATKTNITITGDKNGLTITAENGVADSTTDNLTEGSTNKYFTDERAQDAVGLNVGTGLTYTDSTGEIKVTPNTYDDHGAAAAAKTAANLYTDGKISDLVDGAPGLLDTLNEIAAAINDDASIADTLTTAIGTKVSKAGDVMTGSLTLPGAPTSTLHAATKGYVDTTAGTAQQNAEDYADGLAVNYDANGAADSAEAAANLYTDGKISTEVSDRNSAISTAINALTTSDIEEGSNKYFTDERAQDAVGQILGTGLTYNDSSNTITVDTTNIQLRVTGVSDTEIGYLDGVTSGIQTQIDTKAPTNSPTFTGTVAGITKSMVGLSNVDNTSDANKPVSSATQTALDAKLDSSTAVSTYAPINSPTFTGTVAGITKSMVGLGNVDNTSDANKPVSTAAQTALDAKLALSGGTMIGALTLSGAPTSDLHAATKLYVDNVTAGINFHQAAHVATTANLAANYSNGTNGVGATLTADTNRAWATLDGHSSFTVGDRILIKNQTDAKQNGIYTLTTIGSGSAPWVLTRATDADNNTLGEMKNGDFIFVQNGTVNAGYGFVNNSATNPIVIGTDEITFTEFNAAKTVVAGNGLTEATPGTISIDTSITQTRVSGVSDTEIGYLDGVTSAIQTQIDAKLASSTAASTYAPIASPTFTGTVTIPTGAALGTPASATLTNATGLPVSTGISGFGTGVASFLANPTSGNLATAVTGETGSGALVFGSSPTLKGPIYLQSAGGAGGSANYIDVNGSNGTLSLVSGYPLTLTATGNITLTPTGGAAKVGSDTIATLTATQTLTGKTISGADNTLSNITNSSLTNSKVTVGTTDISLGSYATTLAGLSSVTSTSFVGALTGNASTVTNGVYTTDTGTVTNTMLAGSIGNSKLSNSSISINGTSVSLGGSISGLATLSSPALTGTPTAPTQSAGDNSTNIATTAYADASAAAAAAAIVASAPSTLDTLNELAAALGNDANYATTITTALGNKQDKVTGVSDTEIGYLDGVTSAIQTQIDAKAPLYAPVFVGNITLNPVYGPDSSPTMYLYDTEGGLQLNAAGDLSITPNVGGTGFGQVQIVGRAKAQSLTVNDSFTVNPDESGTIITDTTGLTVYSPTYLNIGSGTEGTVNFAGTVNFNNAAVFGLGFPIETILGGSLNGLFHTLTLGALVHLSAEYLLTVTVYNSNDEKYVGTRTSRITIAAYDNGIDGAQVAYSEYGIANVGTFNNSDISVTVNQDVDNNVALYVNNLDTSGATTLSASAHVQAIYTDQN